MAKLYFNYSSMNAGKSTALLQADHNYRERGMKTVLFTYKEDNRYEENMIVSRIGLKKIATPFSTTTDLYEQVKKRNKIEMINCVLIDF